MLLECVQNLRNDEGESLALMTMIAAHIPRWSHGIKFLSGGTVIFAFLFSADN
jgi:hypothetical protein